MDACNARWGRGVVVPARGAGEPARLNHEVRDAHTPLHDAGQRVTRRIRLRRRVAGCSPPSDVPLCLDDRRAIGLQWRQRAGGKYGALGRAAWRDRRPHRRCALRHQVSLKAQAGCPFGPIGTFNSAMITRFHKNPTLVYILYRGVRLDFWA